MKKKKMKGLIPTLKKSIAQNERKDGCRSHLLTRKAEARDTQAHRDPRRQDGSLPLTGSCADMALRDDNDASHLHYSQTRDQNAPRKGREEVKVGKPGAQVTFIPISSLLGLRSQEAALDRPP